MIKVFIADDSNAIRAAVRRLLESQSDIQVVGEAEEFKQAVQNLQSVKAAEQLGALRVLDKTTLFDTLVPSIR